MAIIIRQHIKSIFLVWIAPTREYKIAAVLILGIGSFEKMFDALIHQPMPDQPLMQTKHAHSSSLSLRMRVALIRIQLL
jgi:hypothetical protein